MDLALHENLETQIFGKFCMIFIHRIREVCTTVMIKYINGCRGGRINTFKEN